MKKAIAIMVLATLLALSCGNGTVSSDQPPVWTRMKTESIDDTYDKVMTDRISTPNGYVLRTIVLYGGRCSVDQVYVPDVDHRW